MDDAVSFVVAFGRVFVSTLVGILRALLPNGTLPRKSVKGDKCLITGAGSGLGRLMAMEFGKAGADLILWDIDEDANNETKRLLEERGVKAYPFTVDLSDRAAINATAERVKKEIGRVDILINNAGIVTGKRLFEAPDHLMEKTIAVNTNALFFTAKNFLPAMLEVNHGHIVTMASLAGKAGAAGQIDYSASKFGAIGFHESLTAELRAQGADGVRTTVVCPYYVKTGMFDGVQTCSPTLLPLLEPDYVVDCIMEAVLTDREELQLPRFAYWANALASVLPSEARHVIADYIGINRTMDTFVGRQKNN